VQEAIVHLAIWMPFEQVGKQLKGLLGVTINTETLRQITEQAGAAYEQVQTQHAQPRAKGRTEPVAPQQLMSSDGAFVRVRGRGWSEVKTLVIGEVLTIEQQKLQRRCSGVHSYFSRLQEVGLFTDRASVEIRRRGLEQAKEVIAVQDGAEWLQGFVDAHRSDAVRILDFAHASSYVSELGEAIQAAGRTLHPRWMRSVLHRLKHDGPTRVLLYLQRLCERYPSPLAREKLRYLQKRETMMQYPTYQRKGWPIGSGVVESANKGVVQARLKGPGMQWKLENVNGMLALRTAECNDRWQEALKQIRGQQRREQKQHHVQQHQQRVQHRFVPLKQAIIRLMLMRATVVGSAPSVSSTTTAPKPRSRPAASHPWRRAFRTPRSTS
jgi:hypothetical protein